MLYPTVIHWLHYDQRCDRDEIVHYLDVQALWTVNLREKGDNFDMCVRVFGYFHMVVVNDDDPEQRTLHFVVPNPLGRDVRTKIDDEDLWKFVSMEIPSWEKE